MTILTLDIGSSSVRTLLFNENGQHLSGAHVAISHHIETPEPGAAVFHVPLLQERVEICVDEILRHPAAKDIQAVGMATFAGNLMGVDKDGVPCTPLFTYADTRGTEDNVFLRSQLDIEEIHRRTGTVLHPAYTPVRLRWLRRTQPDVFAQVDNFCDFATYLYRQWFGSAATTYSLAAWNGLLNIKGLEWDEELLTRLDVAKEMLPALASFREASTGLQKPYRERWAALQETPFFPAIADGFAAHVGSGGLRENIISLTVGTTSAVRALKKSDLSTIPRGLWCYGVDPNLYLIGGALSEGGNIYHWLKNTLRLPEAQAIEKVLAAYEPDSHGLTVLPFLSGERSLGWRDDASGVIEGVRIQTTPLDIVQAGLESVALRISLLVDLVKGYTQSHRLVASGGALAASPAWGQMIASATNLPIHLTAEKELTARGIALLVWQALGKIPTGGTLPPPLRIVQPNARHVAIFARARERQQRLYRRLLESTPLPPHDS